MSNTEPFKPPADPADNEQAELREKQTERRRFARLLLMGAVIAYATPFPFVLWHYLTAPSFKRVTVRPLRIGSQGSLNELLGADGHATLKFGDKNVILLQTAQGVKAFNLRCTHAGCTVEWQSNAQKFVCHCHGGEFRNDGSVAKLPPTQPLEELTLRLENEAYTLYDISIPVVVRR
jgi:Rieske Fe-S protein